MAQSKTRDFLHLYQMWKIDNGTPVDRALRQTRQISHFMGTLSCLKHLYSNSCQLTAFKYLGLSFPRLKRWLLVLAPYLGSSCRHGEHDGDLTPFGSLPGSAGCLLSHWLYSPIGFGIWENWREKGKGKIKRLSEAATQAPIPEIHHLSKVRVIQRSIQNRVPE